MNAGAVETPHRTGPSTVLSRHATGTALVWRVEARNANASCRIPGSPFSPGFILRPNPPELPDVTVAFGPFNLPTGINTVTVFSVSDRPKHRNVLRVDVAILDSLRTPIATSTSSLRHGDETCSTLSVDAMPATPIHLMFGVAFEQLIEPSRFGTIEIRYVLGYERNPLVDLFNVAGSDKGTEVRQGQGVPHCYGLDYYRLFSALQGDTFNFLEIGLQNRKDGARPTDAPSLRAWRQFFPNATLYGYDISDFSFLLAEKDTITFQGDQSSRQDLDRFLRSTNVPQFRLVIDDGSHVPSHQQISLATLFPQVEPGGMYIIEDLGWQPYPESPRTLDVLRRHIHGAGIRSPFISDAEARYLEGTIARIEIFKPNDSEFALIRKKEE